MHHHEPTEDHAQEWPLARGVDGFIVERYRTHHVLIDANHFTMEHPLTCDLSKCDLYYMAMMTWDAPPAEIGWWKVDPETLECLPPESRVSYHVTEIRPEG